MNILFEYIFSFELYIAVYFAEYFAWSRIKEITELSKILAYIVFAKCVRLCKKMWKYNLNFHNKHRI